MDQIIKMTINRFPGGLSGKTENVGASERWMRINHYLADLKQHLEEKVQKKAKPCHVEFGKKHMEFDKAVIQGVVEVLYSWVPHLWTQAQPLVNLCTGDKASEQMIRNVTTTKEREVARKEFFDRITKPPGDLQSNLPSVTASTSRKSDQPGKAATKYHDPIKK